MIRTLIIEDEKGAQDLLVALLKEDFPEVEVCGIAANVNTAVEQIEQLKPELVFLDIRLGENSGFEALERTTYKDFKLIFLTAHSGFALQAIKVSALDYLLKPIDIDDLSQALHKFKAHKTVDDRAKIEWLQAELSKQHGLTKRVALPTATGYEFYASEDISHLIADDNYTRVYFKNGDSRLISRTLGSFEDVLNPSLFLRIHKSHIVNLNAIKIYRQGSGGMVEMSDGTILDVSRRKKSELLSVFSA